MARMQRKFADVRKAAADKAAATRDDYRRTYSQNLGKRKFGKTDTSQLNRDASQLPILKELNQLRDDAWDAGKEGIYGLWGAALKGLKSATSAYVEGQEARRDDKKWTLGGDPLDINKGSMADKWMQTQILPEYMDEYERERDKNNLSWTELGKYTGPDTAGLAERINVLNNLTPERLERYSPIKQRNILESIVNPAEADAFRISDVGQEGILNNAMLMDYINDAKDLYGDGGLPSIAVDDEIMNYRDPIRDMTPQDNRITWSDQGTDPFSDQGTDPFYGGRSLTDEMYASTFKMNPSVEGSYPLSRQYNRMRMAGLIPYQDDDEEMIAMGYGG